LPTTDEVRTTSATGGEKGVKLARFDLLPPDALRQVAEHYGRGAEKYAERNWELGYEWSKAFGAMMRHAWAFWGGEDIDPETGSHHLAAAVFHCFSLMTWTKTHPEFDNRSVIESNEPLPWSGSINMQAIVEDERRDRNVRAWESEHFTHRTDDPRGIL